MAAKAMRILNLPRALLLLKLRQCNLAPSFKQRMREEVRLRSLERLLSKQHRLLLDYDSPKAHLQQKKQMEGSVEGGVVTAILLHTLYGIIAAHTIHDAVHGFV